MIGVKGWERKHGMTYTRLYGIWLNMKNRCYNKSVDSYRIYGERGITVCDEWLGDNGSTNFINWAMENGFDFSKSSREQSLDRIDVDKGYSPSNCRWSDIYEQSNNKRTNHRLTYCGETMTIAQWARELNIDYKTLAQRIYRGWTPERAIETPVGADKWHKQPRMMN